MFQDRTDAGEQLGRALAAGLPGPPGARTIVLAIPRGGVIVAVPVARALGAPLDVVVPRKLGAPDNPEMGIGAVAPGVRVIDRGMVEALRVPEAYVEREAERQLAEVERRTEAYRAGRPRLELEGATVVVVDDGIATGATAVAALRWARDQGTGTLVFAAPVGPGGIEERLSEECDRCVVLRTPRDLRAVGQWYAMFDQVTDDEVRAALEAAA